MRDVRVRTGVRSRPPADMTTSGRARLRATGACACAGVPRACQRLSPSASQSGREWLAHLPPLRLLTTDPCARTPTDVKCATTPPLAPVVNVVQDPDLLLIARIKPCRPPVSVGQAHVLRPSDPLQVLGFVVELIAIDMMSIKLPMRRVAMERDAHRSMHAHLQPIDGHVLVSTGRDAELQHAPGLLVSDFAQRREFVAAEAWRSAPRSVFFQSSTPAEKEAVTKPGWHQRSSLFRWSAYRIRPKC